jgi:uncharacterized protein (TIGR02118 family)
MFQLTVLHNHPADPETFDDYYHRVHLPMSKQIPGVRRFTVTKCVPDADGAKPAHYLVAVLEWDDEESYTTGMASPEGQTALDDLPNFTAAGCTFLIGSSIQLI